MSPDVHDDDLALAGTEVHWRTATGSGREYKIFVGHCATDDGRPPGVLYVTDANGFFGGAVDMVRNMQHHSHVPPLLVVGIGYPRDAVVRHAHGAGPRPHADASTAATQPCSPRNTITAALTSSWPSSVTT